jgi:hypothetical protein
LREVITKEKPSFLANDGFSYLLSSLVRMRGLEPPCLAALAPKTSVSTIPPHPRVSELTYFTLKTGNGQGVSYNTNIMKKQLHLIYVPGLGDAKVAGQRRAVSTWRWYGVEAELFQMNWSDNVSWPVKFGKLLARMDALTAEGKQVGLVGASAGASACINAFAARPDKIIGVVSIAGKINHPETIGQKVRAENPSFIESAYAASKALETLGLDQRWRILSIYSVKDGLLMRRDSQVSGAHNRLTLVMGHPFVIAAQITLGAPGFIWFLRKQYKR